MKNLTFLVLVILAVGCGGTGSAEVDATFDGSVPEVDAGSDVAVVADAGIDSSVTPDAGSDSGAVADAGVDSSAVDAGSSTPDAGSDAGVGGGLYHIGIEVLGYHVPKFRRRASLPGQWAYHDPNPAFVGSEAPDVRPDWAPTYDANAYDLATGATAHWTRDLGYRSAHSIAVQDTFTWVDVEGLGDYVGDTVSSTETIVTCGAGTWMNETALLDSLNNGTAYQASCYAAKLSGIYPVLGDYTSPAMTAVAEAPVTFTWRAVLLP